MKLFSSEDHRSGRNRLNSAGRGGGSRREEREREKGLVGSLPPSSSSLAI